MDVVIDTSVLVGLLVPNDRWHSQAGAVWSAITAAGHTAIHFDCVMTEAVSTAVRRLHEKGMAAQVAAAVDRLNMQAPETTVTWVLSDIQRLYPTALDLIRSTAGSLNFNDALIALACRERGIEAIASFDADFDQIDWLRRWARPQDVAGP